MNNMITAFAFASCIGFLGDSGPAESFAKRSVKVFSDGCVVHNFQILSSTSLASAGSPILFNWVNNLLSSIT